MMATQTLSIDSYQDGQQMQVVTELKTEQDPNCSDPDAEGVSPPPIESQTQWMPTSRPFIGIHYFRC